MKRIFFFSVLALGLVAGSWATGSCLAAEKSATQDLPSAEVILDKEAEAVGGKEVNEKVKTVLMKAKLSVGDRKVLIVMHHAGPTKNSMEVTLPAVGSEQLVVSGDLAWITDSIAGSRLINADERKNALAKAEEFDATFRRVGNWRKQFKQAKVVGEETVEGKAAYKVELTTQENQTWMDHYAKDSGLLLRREVIREAPQGKVSQITSFSDYRKVDGITHAFTVRVGGGPMEMVVTIDHMAHNVELPANVFVLPAELKSQAAK